MQALRSFYGFCDRFGLLVDGDGNPLRNPALALELPVIPVKPELDWLRPDEDARMLDDPMNAREDIVVFLLRLTGLRLGEALGLLNRDVNLAESVVVVRESKTAAGYRSIPISPELRPHIASWWAFTKREGLYQAEGPFLVTRNRTAMKPQYVEQVVARVALRAGLARRVTHLRSRVPLDSAGSGLTVRPRQGLRRPRSRTRARPLRGQDR